MAEDPGGPGPETTLLIPYMVYSESEGSRSSPSCWVGTTHVLHPWYSQTQCVPHATPGCYSRRRKTGLQRKDKASRRSCNNLAQHFAGERVVTILYSAWVFFNWEWIASTGASRPLSQAVPRLPPEGPGGGGSHKSLGPHGGGPWGGKAGLPVHHQSC